MEIKKNIGKVIIGKENTIELLLVAMAANGHVLLEDLPGTGKTLLAKSLAKSIGGEFNRIQFTPDLLPSDITGFNFYDMKTGEFRFQKGPLMANVLLADEINRTIPRTQSSLLEGMGEYQVTVDNVTYPLPQPFFVIATQNPIDLEGTYPLPEAQLDRFLFKLNMGYPTPEEELMILGRFQKEDPLVSLGEVTSPQEVAGLIRMVREVFVSDPVKQYIMEIICATRTSSLFSVGASTRGTLCVMRGAQGLAAIRGRDFVLPDDVKYIAGYALHHRLKLTDKERMSGTLVSDALSDIIRKIPVPLS